MSVEEVLPVTPKERAEMQRLMGRTEKQIAEDIQQLKEFLRKSPHLPNKEDDILLRRVLTLNKFSLQKSKEKLDMYYSARTLFPDQYLNNYPLHPDMQKLFEYGIFVPLPRLTPDYSRVTVSKMILYDNPQFNTDHYIRYIFSLYDIRLFYDCYFHEHIIIDLQNIGFNNAISTSPTVVVKAYTILQKSYSDRIKGIHLLNVPSYANSIISLLKSMFKTKMVDRLYIHTKLESLYKHIPKYVLPQDYGGEEKSLMTIHGQWRSFMEKNNELLIKRQSYKSDEKLRQGKLLDPEIFGVQGSFRKLDID